MEPGGPQASLRQASEAAPRNLDIASLDHVCSFVESLSTLASLQATCRTLAPLAKAAAARLDARWQDFLRTAPRPEVHGLSRRARRRAAELDERFKLFVLSERAEAAFEGLSNVQRKHLHFRAGQLGIASASSDEEGVGRVLCLTKPPGWVLEWRAREPPPPPYYPRPSDSCHECGTGLSSRERRNNRNWWRIERGLDADWAFCNSCLYHESEDEDEDEDRWR